MLINRGVQLVAAVALVLASASFAAAQEIHTHNLKFFLDSALVQNLSADQLKSNLVQYATDINNIFAKQTNVRIAFDPETGIVIGSRPTYNDGVPISSNPDLWVDALLTDDPVMGTYGGWMATSGGAGVAATMKFDCIYDPSQVAHLQYPARELQQYWDQISGIVHEFEHVLGPGMGEYYSVRTRKDTTGVAPTLNLNWSKGTQDSYWGTHQDFWNDPLVMSIYYNAYFPKPATLDAAREAVRFADVTVAIINRGQTFREEQQFIPDLHSVHVQIVDANTGKSVPDAIVRIWNSSYTGVMTELPVSSIGAGLFDFCFAPDLPGGISDAFGNANNLKLVKVFADGYDAQARWVTTFDAEAVKCIQGQNQWTITFEMVPEPGTLSLLAAGFLALRRRRHN